MKCCSDPYSARYNTTITFKPKSGKGKGHGFIVLFQAMPAHTTLPPCGIVILP